MNAIADELNARLLDAAYTRFRCAVAFVRWSGLHLIDQPLQRFANRPGTSLECFVGVDLGGTTIEALTYLHELPGCTLHVVRSGIPTVVFHPKVYALEGRNRWWVLIGSGNLSTGGLHSNVEAYVTLEGSGPDRSLLDGLFRSYADPPFTPEHVRRTDADFLRELSAELATYTERAPDRDSGGRPSDPVPMVDGFSPPAPAGRPPATAGGRGRSTRPPQTVPAAPDVLYLELWDETGGGTQVQIPKAAYTGYFGASEDTTTFIQLDTPAGPIAGVRLQWFTNATFRIGLPFVGSSRSGANRRGVLRFERTAPDAYRVSLQLAGQRRYAAWLARCDRQRPGSKRWGIH